MRVPMHQRNAWFGFRKQKLGRFKVFVVHNLKNNIFTDVLLVFVLRMNMPPFSKIWRWESWVSGEDGFPYFSLVLPPSSFSICSLVKSFYTNFIDHIVKKIFQKGSKFYITSINKEHCMCSLQPKKNWKKESLHMTYSKQNF